MENKDFQNEVNVDSEQEDQKEIPKKSPGRPPKKQQEEPVATRKKRKKIDRSEEVLCRSITHGKLIYISNRTGVTVVWNKYGSEELVEYGELLTMRNAQPAFLERPLIIVEDEEVADVLGINRIYENIIDPDNIDKFFNLSLKKIESSLDKVPRGIRKLISGRARELIENGELYDMRKIQLLEKKLNIDLQMFFNAANDVEEK